MRRTVVVGVAVAITGAAVVGCGPEVPKAAPTPVKVAAGVPAASAPAPVTSPSEVPTPSAAPAAPSRTPEPTPVATASRSAATPRTTSAPTPARTTAVRTTAAAPRTTAPPTTRSAEPPEPARAAGGGAVAPVGKDCPASAPIKGNQGSRSTKEWIYHRPGGGSYKVTEPEECFASGSDAEDAGYRAAKN
ncbi:hypothetical protein GCM10028815_04360 [Mariniluteicoccus flavus]